MRDNYRSYYDHSDLSDADIQRQLDAGWLEGPLHYTPWVVNPQAGIYLPEKDKYRPVMDCTRSGLNASLRPSTCKYDMLEDVLRLQTPDCLNSGFDLKDAFYNWPRRQEHCDYLAGCVTRGVGVIVIIGSPPWVWLILRGCKRYGRKSSSGT